MEPESIDDGRRHGHALLISRAAICIGILGPITVAVAANIAATDWYMVPGLSCGDSGAVLSDWFGRAVSVSVWLLLFIILATCFLSPRPFSLFLFFGVMVCQVLRIRLSSGSPPAPSQAIVELGMFVFFLWVCSIALFVETARRHLNRKYYAVAAGTVFITLTFWLGICWFVVFGIT